MAIVNGLEVELEATANMLEVAPESRHYAPCPLSAESLIAARKRLHEISAEFLRDYGISIRSARFVGINFEPPLGVEIGIEKAKVWDYRLGENCDAFELPFNLAEMFS